MYSDTSLWTYGVTYACLTVFIVNLGSLQFVAILSSRKLRQSLYYVTIASLTVADVLIGLFICPTNSLLAFNPQPLDDYSVYVMSFVWGLSRYAPCVSCWGILLLQVYYLCTVLRVKPSLKLSTRASKSLRVLGSLLPWILALSIVPGLMDNSYLFDCGSSSAGIANVCFIFLYITPNLLPLGLAAILVVVNVLIFKCRHSGSSDTPSKQAVSPSDTVKNPYALVVVSLASVVFFLPRATCRIIFMTFNGETYEWYYIITEIIGNVRSAVVPLLWVMDGTIRARMAKVICCRWQQDHDDINDVMRYERLEVRHGANDSDNVGLLR